jgi:DNA processing protein
MTAVLPHEAHLAALSCLEGIGPATLRRLLTMGAPDRVWDLVAGGRVPAGLLAGLPGAGDGLARRWVQQAARRSPAQVWEDCRRLGVGVTSVGAPGYPPCLAGDPDPPVVLFHRGNPDVLSAPRVAVVGTRRATGYGRRVAHELGRDLAAAGICVVSGLALGIDAAAHAGALDAGVAGGPGWAAPAAVVGAGPDAPGPVRNAALARRLIRLGVVLSEAPPGVPAHPWRFPVRNRILAGLADAVVVVESPGAGGSMSTVEHAQARDRPVLAVPGPVDSAVSEGTNALLADGAIVCTGASDVLGILGLGGRLVPGPVDERPAPTGVAAAVLEVLGWRPEPIDLLASRTGLEPRELAVVVGRLEADGWVRSHGGFVERVARPGIRHPRGGAP